jgi:hypothetical protein
MENSTGDYSTHSTHCKQLRKEFFTEKLAGIMRDLVTTLQRFGCSVSNQLEGTLKQTTFYHNEDPTFHPALFIYFQTGTHCCLWDRMATTFSFHRSWKLAKRSYLRRLASPASVR